MSHGYTDDTPHGYRKSFGLIGKVKSFYQRVGIALLNKKKGADTSYFVSYTALQLS